MKKLMLLQVLAIMVIASSARADREFDFNKDEQFDGNAVTSIRIEMASGDIKIEKSTGSEINLQFKNVILASDEEEASEINDRCKFDASLEGNELVIKVERPRSHRSGLLDRILSGRWGDDIQGLLKLDIPDGKSIKIDASSTDIEADEVNAELDIRGSSSDVRIRGAQGNVICDLSSGDIDVFRHKGDISVIGKSSDVRFEDIEGNIDVKTSSGDGRIDNLSGSAVISTSSGDYRIFSVGADLDIRATSGDIYVDGVAGSVRAESSSGDIRLNALSASQGDFRVDSVSGDVTVEISRDFAGRLSLRSSSQISGEIESVSDSRLLASIGQGSGNLKVSTSSGDIRITRY